MSDRRRILEPLPLALCLGVGLLSGLMLGNLPSSSGVVGAPDPQRSLSLEELLHVEEVGVDAVLEARLRELPDFDGTESLTGVEAKYEGLTAQQLCRVLPLVRRIKAEEMNSALDMAIDANLHVTEVVPSGFPVDLSKYRSPTDRFKYVAHRSIWLPDGGGEYKIVSFDKVNFPDQYIRAAEELWIHGQIRERTGECPSPHSQQSGE